MPSFKMYMYTHNNTMPVLGFVHNVLLHCCSMKLCSQTETTPCWTTKPFWCLSHSCWRQSLQCLKIFRLPCTVAILKRNHVLIGVWTILAPWHHDDCIALLFT